MIPAGFTVLRFLLDHGAFVQVVVSGSEAKEIIHQYTRGELPLVIGGTNQFGSWSVKIGSVVAIHTVPAEMMQQGQQGALPGPVWRPGSSGI